MIDWSLYLVTDKKALKGISLLKAVEEALKGGVTVLQYREKMASTGAMVEEAMALRDLCRSFNVPFLVNDRLDVVMAVDADGVHLGQDDMPPPIARRILGPGKIIGLTVHNERELSLAHELLDVIDYVSFAPVFPTSTKPDHKTPLGIEGVARLASLSRLPSVAIGGIKEQHLELLAKTGIRGICVVSAILGSEDPQKVSKRFITLWKQKKI
ncbi:MAG: thiamine phosphate synthase [Syntrophobacterales bacterium]|nr:thiamine phosphate synthase [Syntrophobacterales bacterium]